MTPKEGFESSIPSLRMLLYPENWNYPFQAVASISNTGVITFDQKYYSIEGSCSYLLTRDFYGGEFDIIADFATYEDMNSDFEGFKSLRIRSGTNEWVTLGLDGHVTMNNEEVSLPFTAGNFEITSSGTEIRATLLNDQFEVHCNIDYHVCYAILQGSYFNRVNGLFGNFNYEPFDDVAMIGGFQLENEMNLINYWTVSELCRPTSSSFRRLDEMDDLVNLLVSFYKL